MDVIRGVVLTICCGAAVGGLIQMLCPRGSMSRMMKLAMSLFLAACVILPVAGTDFRLQSVAGTGVLSSAPEAKALTAAVDAQVDRSVAAQAQATVEAVLSQNGYNGCTVNVSVGRDENGNPEVTGITVVVACSSGQAEEITRLVAKATGIQPVVKQEE